MKRPVYTIDSNGHIARDGVSQCALLQGVHDSDPAFVRPDLDAFAREIVAALNSAPTSLHGRMVSACVKVDHHESDLMVEATPTSEAILGAYEFRQNAKPFKGRDGRRWWDIPFAFEPFWERKA